MNNYFYVFCVVKSVSLFSKNYEFFNSFGYCVLDNYVFTFGGEDLNDIFYYNIKKNKWFKSNIKLPKIISNSSVSCIDNKIHVIGGEY